MEELEIEIMGWDVDGTLLDWMAAYVPAYEAMCEAIAAYADKKTETTAAAMKAFYTLKGNLEDEGLIQGLYAAVFFSGVVDFDEGKAIQIAKTAFDSARIEKLNLYPGIEEAIHEIGKRVPQFVLSDGPLIQVRKRLEIVGGLLDQVPHVFGTRSATVPRLSRGLRRDANLNPDFIVDRPKPHTDLEAILHITRTRIEKGLAYAGDNRGKDMGLVERYGATGFLAGWSGLDLDLVRRLNVFAPDANVKNHLAGHAAGASSSSARIFEVRNPLEIPRLLFRI